MRCNLITWLFWKCDLLETKLQLNFIPLQQTAFCTPLHTCLHCSKQCCGISLITLLNNNTNICFHFFDRLKKYFIQCVSTFGNRHCMERDLANTKDAPLWRNRFSYIICATIRVYYTISIEPVQNILTTHLIWKSLCKMGAAIARRKKMSLMTKLLVKWTPILKDWSN